ncbi:hypothetical protein CN354_20795 [Bacillus cereus]|nr:hypothetical protein CN354_20795 [Bacillus cereus]
MTNQVEKLEAGQELTRFTVQGKEYALKINFDSVEYLNGLHSGGAMQLIGKVMSGDLKTFIHIVHAALFHTEKNFAFDTVRGEIEMLVRNEKLDLDDVLKTGYNLVANSFFYKKTVTKMMEKDPKAKEEFEALLK